MYLEQCKKTDILSLEASPESNEYPYIKVRSLCSKFSIRLQLQLTVQPRKFLQRSAIMDDEFLALLIQFSVVETRELSAGDLDLQLAVRFQREDLEHYQRERARQERPRFRTFLDDTHPLHGFPARFGPNIWARSREQNLPTNESLSNHNDLNLDNELASPTKIRRDSMGDVEMQQECLPCGEGTLMSNRVTLLCGHFFCSVCLKRCFRIACDSESSFPPQCCGQAIPVGWKQRILLGPEMLTRYREKKIEFETETANRIYCHQCTTFIPRPFQPTNSHAAYCRKCATYTCLLCKGKRHYGPCPPDRATQQVLNMAQAERWKRCTCGEMIELVAGMY